MTPTCTAHGAPLIAPCARCGVFLCSMETRQLDDAIYCVACVVRPEVDPLASYRARFWGRRRDPWSWIFGVGGVLLVFGTLWVARRLKPADAPLAAIVVGLGALQLAWFTRRRWARYALPASVLVLSAIWLARANNFLSSLPVALFAWACMASAFWSVPGRLFFELDLPRETLRRDFQQYRTNWFSVFSLVFALAAIGVWSLGVLGVICGAIAWHRTSQPFTPPIRGKWVAIAGVVLSVNVLAGHAVAWLS